MAWDVENPENTAALDAMTQAFVGIVEDDEMDEEDAIITMVIDVMCDALGYEPKAIRERIVEHVEALEEDEDDEATEGGDTSIDERDETPVPAPPDPQRSLSVQGRSGI